MDVNKNKGSFMKKYIAVLILSAILLTSILLNTSFYYDKYLSMTRDLTTIIGIRHFIEDPKILIPTYDMDENNPYLHVAVEAISLERSRQYGEWNGYYIYITPNKLSDSELFSISLSCRSSDQNITTELTWGKKDVTSDFISGDNYPDGTYTRYIGTLLKDGYSYEITGFVFGPVDDNRDQVILEELLYLTEGLEHR